MLLCGGNEQHQIFIKITLKMLEKLNTMFIIGWKVF